MKKFVTLKEANIFANPKIGVLVPFTNMYNIGRPFFTKNATVMISTPSGTLEMVEMVEPIEKIYKYVRRDQLQEVPMPQSMSLDAENEVAVDEVENTEVIDKARMRTKAGFPTTTAPIYKRPIFYVVLIALVAGGVWAYKKGYLKNIIGK